jgi:hypothetical protein
LSDLNPKTPGRTPEGKAMRTYLSVTKPIRDYHTVRILAYNARDNNGEFAVFFPGRSKSFSLGSIRPDSGYERPHAMLESNGSIYELSVRVLTAVSSDGDISTNPVFYGGELVWED